MQEQEWIEIAIPLVGIPVAGVMLFKRHFASHNHAKRLLSFNSLDECMSEMEQIRNAKQLHIENSWDLYQNLVHCAQSIEFSMIGFPQNKPKIIQNTVGAMIFHQFEKQGYMRHNRSEDIPGAMPVEPAGRIENAIERLTKSVNDFEHFDRELRPHFAYGKLTKSEYVKAHCMHLADHFAMMTY